MHHKPETIIFKFINIIYEYFFEKIFFKPVNSFTEKCDDYDEQSKQNTESIKRLLGNNSILKQKFDTYDVQFIQNEDSIKRLLSENSKYEGQLENSKKLNKEKEMEKKDLEEILIWLQGFIESCRNVSLNINGIFFGQKQPILTERIINGFVRSTISTIDCGRFMVTNAHMEMLIAFFIITVMVILFKLFKKRRHSTPNPTNFNVFNTMRLESSRNHTSVYGEYRNINVDSRSIKAPEVFKEGMDLKSWFILMEIYSKNFPKYEWLEVAISYIENKVLRKVKNLEEFIFTRSYVDFKTKLFDAFTVKPREIPVILKRLTDYKQSQKDSIREYGESIVNIVKKLFPNVNDSNDIIQECFVEGLYDKRLREAVRLKLFKMKNIKKNESFKIHDLIKSAECKNSSFDSSSPKDQSMTSSDGEQYHGRMRNSNGPLQQQNRYQNIKKNFQKQVGFQLPSNGPNQKINYLSHVPSQNLVLNKNEPIIEEYHGGKLYTASGEIQIFGLVRLKRCLIVPVVQLNNTNILVTNDLGHQCLLGRDIINRIPDLKKRIDSTKTIYQEYSLRLQTNQFYSVAKDINFNKSKLIKTDSNTNVKPIQNGKFMYGFNNFQKQKNVWCSNLRYGQEIKCGNCPNISWWKKRKEKLNAKLAINE
ncbi:unnamed protein product [Brachionus calyciflorus]|uniref:Retrotransposon gag domain-containing protein n=1 Tax=Brachionus calyciflorus TaxID=104777 RepID=A0A814EXT3_9BILA|nr:unnamed protein product [Brachionus calyciflorus]